MLNTCLTTTITSETKICPAFAPFLADSGPDDSREAIVIFRSPDRPPELEEPSPSGRLRALAERLKEVESRKLSQQAVQREVINGYRQAGGKSRKGKQELRFTAIGSNALPVAAVEVTPRTLPILAEMADVVAILPNQRINLIRSEERRVGKA